MNVSKPSPMPTSLTPPKTTTVSVTIRPISARVANYLSSREISSPIGTVAPACQSTVVTVPLHTKAPSKESRPPTSNHTCA